MLAKLAGHSMFAEPGALDRLRMCADCRVVDLIKSENSVDIRDAVSGVPDRVPALRLPEEDRARAEFYALLARLYGAAPDAPLLAALRRRPSSGPNPTPSPLAGAWNRLVLRAAAADGRGGGGAGIHRPFRRRGKERSATCTRRTGLSGRAAAARRRSGPSSRGWASSAPADRPSLRGPSRRALRSRCACSWPAAPAAAARRSPSSALFRAVLSAWVDRCCIAISQCPIANYYRRVAEFTSLFLAVERDSFAID